MLVLWGRACAKNLFFARPATLAKFSPKILLPSPNHQHIYKIKKEDNMKFKFDEIEHSNSLYEVQEEDVKDGVFVVPDDIEVIERSSCSDLENLKKVILPKGLKKISSYAFSNCVNLEEIEIPEGVSFIGPAAFANCKSLKKIKLPSTVTKIIRNTFEDCTKLEEINLPEHLESIASCTFKNCYNLKELTIPDTVKEIESYAFSYCKKLSSIKLSKQLTLLDDGLFSHCYSLKKIELPENLETISNDVFEGCESLNEIKFNKKLKSINDHAFKDCWGLTSIKLPDSIEHLGDGIFLDCALLESADLTSLNNFTILPYGIFAGCSNLETVKLPDSIETFESSTFSNCSSLTSFKFPKSIKRLGSTCFFNSGLENVVLPDTIISLDGYNFENCNNLKSIKFPKNLGIVPTKVCHNCPKLTSVELPENAKILSAEPFGDCINLEHIDLPNSLEKISSSAFAGCEKLKSIKIPENVTSIERNAFFNCSSLEKVSLPSNLKVISNKLFFGCYNLKSIILPDTVEKIDDLAFNSCINLKQIYLPTSLKVIGSSAFANCTKLENAVLPENLEELGTFSFSNCKNLKEVAIPFKVKSIPSSCFSLCGSLESVKTGKNVTNIGENAFKSCSSLKNVAFSNKLESIGEEAFYNCSELESLNLPNSLKEIASYAFGLCKNLKTLKIPENVTKLGYNFVFNCENLKDLYFPSSIKFVDESIFDPSKPENHLSGSQDDRFLYFKKELQGFSLHSEQDEQSSMIPLNMFQVNPAIISNCWDSRDIIFKEQKNPLYADVYNKIIPNLTSNQADNFVKSHNFSFLRQFDTSNLKYLRNLEDDVCTYFYKALYNLGGFSKPVVENGKTINLAQKVCEFLLLKINNGDVNLSTIADNFANTKFNGPKPEFTYFYLKDFDNLQSIDDYHEDFISRCYTEFEAVQKTNTNNHGSQRQLKPTIEKFQNYFDENKFVGINDETREIYKVIAPYFDTQEIFNRAVAIDKERIQKNIPNNILSSHLEEQTAFKTIDDYAEKIKKLQNACLNKMTDIATKEFSFEWLEKNDPRNLILGKLCTCCAHVDGAGYGIMRASIIHPNVQNMVIKDKNGTIIAKSTLYINPTEGYGVFNNVEINDNISENDLQFIYEKYILGVDTFAKKYNQEHKDHPLKIINVGMNFNDLASYIQAFNKRSTKLYKSLDYGAFCSNGHGYNGDSEHSQFTIWEIGDEKNERQY